MKIGKISYVNGKGQLVIPKKLRDELDITKDKPLHIVKKGSGVYVYPISSVPPPETVADDAYDQVLEDSQGMWAEDSGQGQARDKQQRDSELKATRRGKKAW